MLASPGFLPSLAWRPTCAAAPLGPWRWEKWLNSTGTPDGLSIIPAVLQKLCLPSALCQEQRKLMKPVTLPTCFSALQVSELPGQL